MREQVVFYATASLDIESNALLPKIKPVLTIRNTQDRLAWLNIWESFK